MAKRDFTEEVIDNILRQKVLSEARKNQKKNYILGTFGLYAIVLVAVVISKFGGVDIGALNNSSDLDKKELEGVKQEVSSMRGELDSLNDTVKANPNPELAYIYSELDILKKESKSISDTISIDPQKAITAVILRNQMDELETRVIELREGVDKNNSLLVQLLLAALLLPLLALFWKFVENKFFNKATE